MIEVREAELGDLDAILAIYNDAVVHTTATYDYEARTREAQAQWFEAKRAQGLPVLVGLEAGTVCGFASYGPFRPWAAYLSTRSRTRSMSRPSIAAAASAPRSSDRCSRPRGLGDCTRWSPASTPPTPQA